MNRLLAAGILFAILSLPVVAIRAQEAAPEHGQAKGSTAFCLYELPAEENGKRRWINLGIVQYLEFGRNELRIYFGGGNLGSGHEAELKIASPEELDDRLESLRQTAADCR